MFTVLRWQKNKQCLTFSQQTHVAQQVRFLSLCIGHGCRYCSKKSRKTRQELGFKVTDILFSSFNEVNCWLMQQSTFHFLLLYQVLFSFLRCFRASGQLFLAKQWMVPGLKTQEDTSV